MFEIVFEILYRANGRGGFGSQTAADTLWCPPQNPWQADRGYCDEMLQSGAAWAEERLWVPSGSLSVPQNGWVHLHIIEKLPVQNCEKSVGEELLGNWTGLNFFLETFWGVFQFFFSPFVSLFVLELKTFQGNFVLPGILQSGLV